MAGSLKIDNDLAIPLSEIVIRATRSGGPGGQHANVTASRIEASFDLAESRTLTGEQASRLRRRYGPKVSAVSQEARGQARNREIALERLADKISAGLRVPKKRRPTRPTRASRERRIDAKRRRSQVKRARRRPIDEQ